MVITVYSWFVLSIGFACIYYANMRPFQYKGFTIKRMEEIRNIDAAEVLGRKAAFEAMQRTNAN